MSNFLQVHYCDIKIGLYGSFEGGQYAKTLLIFGANVTQNCESNVSWQYLAVAELLHINCCAIRIHQSLLSLVSMKFYFCCFRKKKKLENIASS